jgi:hypothetical protein
VHVGIFGACWNIQCILEYSEHVGIFSACWNIRSMLEYSEHVGIWCAYWNIRSMLEYSVTAALHALCNSSFTFHPNVRRFTVRTSETPLNKPCTPSCMSAVCQWLEGRGDSCQATPWRPMRVFDVSHIFYKICSHIAVKLSALRAGRPFPQKDPWYSFLLEAEWNAEPQCGWPH